MIHGTRPRPASILPTTHAPALLRDGVPGRTALLTIPPGPWKRFPGGSPVQPSPGRPSGWQTRPPR